MRKLISFLLLGFFCINSAICYGGSFPEKLPTVYLEDTDDGWKLMVKGKPYIIKGVEYSVSTVGEKPATNDWMFQDENNNGKIDGPYDAWVDLNGNNYQDIEEKNTGDFALLKAMGCNTIRIYHCEKINKKLLRDLYENYGIMVIMGNLFGAYTKGSNATWASGTDYTNKEHKKNMLNSIKQMVEEYKDEPFILMWMLGNENDVDGKQINSTATNTNAGSYPEEFAKFLEEACTMIKKIDKNHPVGVCNATVKFLKYYKQYCPSLDVFGINQYTGPFGFGNLWAKAEQELGKPVLVTEYGCDAYNTNKNTTNESYQVRYHRGAWKDIIWNSYLGNGTGNSLGGVVYCWLDKWWLIGSPSVHDTVNGAWKGVTIDGLFNDEWLGICSQGKGLNSPFQRILRNVFYLYRDELWNR